jgi:hypothetical protein
MMDERLYDTFEQALAELEAGAEFETVLAAYPELRSELETAQMAKSSVQPDIPPGAANRSRTQILARAMQLRQGSQPRQPLFSRAPRFVITLIIVAVFLLSGSGLVAASAQAIPGDQLYSVKRTFETVRLGLTISPQSHQQIEVQYQSRRLDEVKRLLALGRLEMVQFDGVVDQQEDGSWKVSGIQVRLTLETIVLGDILPGMTVEVEGTTQPEGWVQASEIHLQTFGFAGYVESISAEVWQIAGRKVNIIAESMIDSDIQVGDWVMVFVQSDDFGILTAHIIELSNLPTPTVPIPTATPTLTQSPLAIPDDDQVEVEDESNSDDEGKDRQGENTETPEVEDTHQSDETDEPEKTEKPDKTDESDDHDEHDD